jgi:hypothetical protein
MCNRTAMMKKPWAPWDNDTVPFDAGFKVKTSIRTSSIPNIGRGRFVEENVKKGQVIRRARVVFNDGRDDSGPLQLEPVTIVLSRDRDAMLKAFGHCDPTKIVHFGSAMVGPVCSGRIAHWVPSNYQNHFSPPTVLEVFDTDTSSCLIVAARDLRAGDELFIDYTNSQIPLWFREYCQSIGMEDACTMGHAYKKNKKSEDDNNKSNSACSTPMRKDESFSTTVLAVCEG